MNLYLPILILGVIAAAFAIVSVGIALLMLFPRIALWLPSQIG